MDAYLLNELKNVSHSMFSKNYFGVFHGSISAKIAVNAFVINKKEVILDEVNKDDFIELVCNIKKITDGKMPLLMQRYMKKSTEHSPKQNISLIPCPLTLLPIL